MFAVHHSFWAQTFELSYLFALDQWLFHQMKLYDLHTVLCHGIGDISWVTTSTSKPTKYLFEMVHMLRECLSYHFDIVEVNLTYLMLTSV